MTQRHGSWKPRPLDVLPVVQGPYALSYLQMLSSCSPRFPRPRVPFFILSLHSTCCSSLVHPPVRDPCTTICLHCPPCCSHVLPPKNETSRNLDLHALPPFAAHLHCLLEVARAPQLPSCKHRLQNSCIQQCMRHHQCVFSIALHVPSPVCF